jgi:hypothetical protein
MQSLVSDDQSKESFLGGYIELIRAVLWRFARRAITGTEHQQTVKFRFGPFHFEGPTFLTLLEALSAFVPLTLAIINFSSFEHFHYFTLTLATCNFI